MASDVPSREHSHFNLQQSSQPDPALEDRLCPGCKRSAVNEQGGLVVAFGSSFFHVDCFKCAKCHNQVTADTNLLLLSDGSPICANCSYSCNVCKQPILDEAIMAGDDSYHAHCFKCKVCKNRIDELVFAKTSQGIYCMNCHNDRMIRIRKHAQKKAERERAMNGGGSTSSKSRDRDGRTHNQDVPGNETGNSLNSQYQNGAHKPTDLTGTPSRPEITPQNLSQTLDISARSTPAPSPYAPVFSPNFNVSLTIDSPPRTSSIEALQNYERGPSKQSTLPLPSNLSSRNARRSVSYDNSLKATDDPMNEFGQKTPMGGSNNLSVTSRQEKRRSINPGLALNAFDFTSLSAAANPSPRSDSSQLTATHKTQFHDNQQDNGQDSARRSSNTTSLHSLHTTNSHSSHHPISRSRSPSIVTQDYDQQDDTVVLKSPTADAPGSTNAYPSQEHQFTAGLSPNNPRSNFAAQQQQRLSVNSTHSYDTQRSGGSRSASPAYRADVPHGVESGTDTDDDGPPLPPPKDPRAATKSPENLSDSFDSQDADSSDADLEQPHIERHTRSTYIAPALPPIRVSLTTDLSEFLNGKSISDLAKLAEQSAAPPPTQNAQVLLGNIGEEEPDTPTLEDSSSHGHGSAAGHSSTTGHTERSDSASSMNSTTLKPTPTVSVTQPPPGPPNLGPRQKASGADIVTIRLREALENAKERGAQQLKLDRAFVEAIVGALDSRTADLNQMKAKFDGVKRTSRQYIEGFQVAQTEYDRELKARRDAEAEVTRLRVLLSGQAARLTALTGDSKRQEVRQQMTKDLHDSLHGLENDLSRLKAERDMTIMEMEELSATKSSGAEAAPSNLNRALTKRLDGLRSQYRHDLTALQQEHEHLNREITELKAVRDLFLEETATLNARNEELAQLSAVYTRRMDTIPETPMRNGTQQAMPRGPGSYPQGGLAPSLSASTSSTSTIQEDPNDIRQTPTPAKKFKWIGSGSRGKDVPSQSNGMEFSKSKAHIEHNFQQVSLLHLNSRCKHCGDKLWGSQLRCTVCSTSIHVRCIANVQVPCIQPNGAPAREEPQAPLPPSMFGRELVEQVRADAKDTDRQVPVIVEKCIDAVEALALDYEGIYRKTGGSGQQRAITQLFERGDYDSFDLLDSDKFNDICSVTSVLKTYFRSLPIPLLTFDLYDQFIQAMTIREPAAKHQTLIELVNQLPAEHYFTLQKLSIHLHHVQLLKDINRMDARNLGVVFGPTLMKSRDPGAEFSDMAGKSLFIQWLIENAPEIFNVHE